MNSIKSILKAITPHGLVELRRQRLFPSDQATPGLDRERFHEERRQKIAVVRTSSTAQDATLDGTDRAAVAGYLQARGIPLHHIAEGSMPEASLAFMREHLHRRLPPAQPLLALHIGNFVGVSLAFLSATLKQLHPESLVLAVDPNLPHRGVVNPQEHVAALLCACGLQRNTMLIAGYSGEKSVSNDGVDFGGYDPVQAFAREAACEQILRNLGKFLAGRCHLVMMDGNHEAGYLEAEIREVRPLMQDGSLLILDDVDTYWAEIRQVFEKVQQLGLKPIGADGRIGIAQVV